MARLIKLANSTKPMIKLSSQEWLNAGINSGLFYSENDTIKVAQLTNPPSGTNPVIGAGSLFDENQAKLKDPAWQKALGDYRGRRVSQGFSVVETAPGSGIFGLKNNATGKLNMPGRGNQNLAAALNSVGKSAAAGGVILPSPVPVTPPVTPTNTDPNQTTATTPKPTDWARRAKLLGAGLAGGAAGYYGTGAIADALQTNNNLKDPNRAQDFYRGAAALQQSVSPILGISKSLNKTVQEMMRTIAELQVQMQKTQPMKASPTLQRQNAIMSAAEAKNTLPSQGADYLPQ